MKVICRDLSKIDLILYLRDGYALFSYCIGLQEAFVGE